MKKSGLIHLDSKLIMFPFFVLLELFLRKLFMHFRSCLLGFSFGLFAFDADHGS